MQNQIRNLGFGGRTCLDSPARKKDLKKSVGLYPCHKQGGNQVNSCILTPLRGEHPKKKRAYETKTKSKPMHDPREKKKNKQTHNNNKTVHSISFQFISHSFF